MIFVKEKHSVHAALRVEIFRFHGSTIRGEINRVYTRYADAYFIINIVSMFIYVYM